MSRKVTAHQFSSVNGVAEDPHIWQFAAFGPEDMELMAAAIGTVTDVVIGRVLWEQWSQYWPGAADPFGAFINPVRKHVVTSRGSGELGWNSVAIEGSPVEYVRRLRASGEGDISVAGGLSTVRSLFVAGVVDELSLTIHPVVTNEGRRLFDDGVPTTRLELLRAVPTSAGNISATYALRPA